MGSGALTRLRPKTPAHFARTPHPQLERLLSAAARSLAERPMPRAVGRLVSRRRGGEDVEIVPALTRAGETLAGHQPHDLLSARRATRVHQHRFGADAAARGR